jgi:hypothetical protein
MAKIETTPDITCGSCNEVFNYYEFEDHPCDSFWKDREMDELTGSVYSTFKPHPKAYLEARAFLDKHPEFDENSSGWRPKGTDGSSYSEQEAWINDGFSNYETETGIPYEPDYRKELPYGEFTSEEVWEGIYSARAVYQEPSFGIRNWRDTEPNRVTTVKHWWFRTEDGSRTAGPTAYAGPAEHLPKVKSRRDRKPIPFTTDASYRQRYEGLDYSDKRLARLSFSELEDFHSQLLIDLDVTTKFHNTVFNAYWGNDGYFHIGRLTFKTETSGKVSVTCKQDSCFYRNHALVCPEDATPEERIEFTRACIRHGNNHGPSWITSRSDFTRIHSDHCDFTHDVTVSACNSNQQRTLTSAATLDPEDFDEVFGYLIAHRKVCSGKGCRCTHYYHLLSAVDRSR